MNEKAMKMDRFTKIPNLMLSHIYFWLEVDYNRIAKNDTEEAKVEKGKQLIDVIS